MPWSGLIERKVSQALERATPAMLEQAKREVVTDMARAMASNPYMPQVPITPPTSGNSPLPLYGLDNPLWYSTPTSPQRRKDSWVDVRTLRRFADTYDVLRSCINHLKREVQAQPLSVAPKDERDDSPSTVQRVKDALDLLNGPNTVLGDFHQTRRIYEALIFEDALVVGAYAAFKNYARGGRLLNVVHVPSDTIRPRMDAYGWPGPGEDYYEQWIQGMQITGFKPEELTYTGPWPVPTSPFYGSPVEWLITTILSALESDKWNRSWLTTGNTPGQAISVPEGWTPQQIIEYRDILLAMMAGNTEARQQMFFLPGGAKADLNHSRKDQDFQEFELWLLRRTCAVMGVQPASIGFAGEQYKVSQEGSNDQTTQFGAGALLTLRKEHYDDILNCLGYGDLEVFNGSAAQETDLEIAQRLTISTGGASWISINEARKITGNEPRDDGDTLLVPNNLTTIDNILTPPEAPGGVTANDQATDGIPTANEDMARWERKALNRLKARGNASCEFRSESIATPTALRIAAALKECRTPSDVKRVFEVDPDIDDEDEPEPDEKKRKRLWLLLVILGEKLQASLLEVVALLELSEISLNAYVEQTLTITTTAYIEAVRIGQDRAGIVGGLTDAQVQAGIRMATKRTPGIQDIGAKIQNQDLSEKQIAQRIKGITEGIVGAANEGWRTGLAPDVLITWHDTGDSGECNDCVRLAAGSPYTVDTLPTIPGAGETQCYENCRCYLETDGGQTSFYDPNDLLE